MFIVKAEKWRKGVFIKGEKKKKVGWGGVGMGGGFMSCLGDQVIPEKQKLFLLVFYFVIFFKLNYNKSSPNIWASLWVSPSVPFM